MLLAPEKHVTQLEGVTSSISSCSMIFQMGETWGGSVMGNLMGHMRFEPSLEELGQFYKQGHCEQC